MRTDKFHVEMDREDDGRYLAEVPELPGVLAYGDTAHAAMHAVIALALRVLADQYEHGDGGCVAAIEDLFVTA